jgi:hypothetical protein
VCNLLRAEGHDVVEASRTTGVDVLTGDGVAEALQDAHVLVDVLNSPSFDDEPVLQFFSSATRNLVGAVRHGRRVSRTTSRCRSSATPGCPTADTCGRRWRRRR